MDGGTNDKINVNINLTPTLDVRTSDFKAYGALEVGAVAEDGTAAQTNTLNTVTFTIVGVEVEARQAEENFRRTSIISTQETATLQYEIPAGRTFGADRSHKEASDADARNKQVANLINIATIGIDEVAIKTIESYLDTVADENVAYAADPINNKRPGDLFAAGGKIIPTVINDTLDLSSVDSFDDSRRRQAIIHKVESFFGSVVCDLMQQSLMRQQMAPGSKLVLRCLTTGTLLSNVFAVGSTTGEDNSAAGVEYTMELPDGTLVEFVTTTFKSFGQKALMIPFIREDASSDLNFGHNRNCGTHVAAFNATMDGANAQRIMASVRELVVPSNVVGASITVTGVDVANFRSE